MKSIFVLMCLCVFGLSRVYGASNKVLDFTSFFNGDFDNKAQTEKLGDNHDFIQTRHIPVDIKCLRPDRAVFLEEAVNNVIRVLYLVVVTDGIEDTISLTIYNFTDITKYRPREFKVESLSNISCEDLQGDPDCIASYRVPKEEGFAYGNFPYCAYTVNGKHPRFTGMHTCDTITMTVALYSQQGSPIEPYELLRTGKKYPLINPPANYTPPCGN